MNRCAWLSVSGLLFAGFVNQSAQSREWGCRVTAERSAGIDAAGAEKVIIRAGAGDLEVRGVANAKRIEARGGACASRQELLAVLQINVRREANVIYIETDLPQYDTNKYPMRDDDVAYLNLGIAVPNNLPIEGIDSSGDAILHNLASLDFQDSSGDLRVSDIAGAVKLQDSSGDLLVENAASAHISDSSGDIRVRRIKGDAVVAVDSSGNIRMTDVGGNAEVEIDSSGSIEVEDVAGDFRVGSDGSGEVSYARVGGTVTIPD